MANLLAIHSVGNSLITYLRNSYPKVLRDAHSCEFKLLSSGELAANQVAETALSLFLYRVSVNEHLRNSRRLNDLSDGDVPLAVDLHYLLTVWAKDALTEHSILAWAMRQLHLHPVLDSSSLSPEAEWVAGDVVHIVPSELSNEDVMRLWDTLEPHYRLSVSYVARVVRIDTGGRIDGRSVVASRFSWTGREAEP